MNMVYLDALSGNCNSYVASVSGRCPAGIVDEVLLLKEGARVIFTSNDVRMNQYKNGSVGMVVNVGMDDVIVETGGALSKKEIGSAWQLPLKVAKAITVHRSQGQTFDYVTVNPDVFAPGQLYVALSRVRSPEGLVLTRPLTKEDLILDPVVQKFYTNGYTWEVKKPAAKSSAKQSGVAKKPVKKTAKSTAKTKKTTVRKSAKKKG